jgi:NAD(P)-dependent dehydrogenase (short-subunit alcohol dehydrogenase family)
MTDLLDLTGKTAIVTGGTRGVGRGVAERLLEAGAQVVVCGRTTPESLPAAGSATASFVEADVRDVDHIARVVAQALQQHGSLDILVNNAGGAPNAEAAAASPRFSEAIIRLNLIAPLNFAQQANRVMQQQVNGGCIINVASVSGVRPSPGTAAYGAAKAGLLNLTMSLAVEWAPKVRMNAITAGPILTEQAGLHFGDAEGVQRVAQSIPLGRLGVPRDVGDICVFLASPLAGYVSGANLLLHGGGERPAFLDAVRGS